MALIPRDAPQFKRPDLRHVTLERHRHDMVFGVRELQRDLERTELLGRLKEAIETTLTAHQRRVFVALALNEVPIDVLAERLHKSRGALYKTLHDARRKLRDELADAGLVEPARERGGVDR